METEVQPEWILLAFSWETQIHLYYLSTTHGKIWDSKHLIVLQNPKLPKQHSNESLHLTSTKNKQNTLSTVQQELNNFTQTQSRGGTYLQSQERLKQRYHKLKDNLSYISSVCLFVCLSIKFKIRTSETKPKAPRLILIRKFCHPST